MSARTDVQAGGRSARRWIIGGVVAVVVVIALVLLAVFTPSGRVPDTTTRVQRDLMGTSTAPGGNWTVRVYYVNPGAAGSAFVVVEATPRGGAAATEILRLSGDQLNSAQWADDEHLTIKWVSPKSIDVGGYPATVPGS